MSTQKNEHNPDNLTPEQVGKGFRLLQYGEVIDPMDEMYITRFGNSRWEPTGPNAPGHIIEKAHYAHRRRITPPTDTTGSGTEGETVTFLTAALAEQIEQARKWKEHYATDPKGQSDKAFWDGKERALTECLHLIQSTTDRLTAQVEALRRDGERMDWLETLLKKSKRYWPLVHISTLPSQMMIGACNTHHGNEAGLFTEPTLRAAIDSAQRQEGE